MQLLKPGSLPGVLRSKGRVWSAGDHIVAIDWSQAGFATTLKAGGKWLPAFGNGWPKELIEKYGDSLYADRRQELVFIGNAMDEPGIRQSLDALLLTDEEFALGPQGWMRWTKLVSTEALDCEDRGKEPEFTVELRKLGAKQGLGIAFDETQGIRVTGMMGGGLMSNWNIENPDSAVKEGYQILEVNGFQGEDGLKQIWTSDVWRIKVSRLRLLGIERRFP